MSEILSPEEFAKYHQEKEEAFKELLAERMKKFEQYANTRPLMSEYTRHQLEQEIEREVHAQIHEEFPEVFSEDDANEG
jgi:hypothetical protein